MIRSEAKASLPSFRTWKESLEMEREVKRAFIDKLSRMPYISTVVRSEDEVGPIQRIPRGGSGGFPRERFGRIQAEKHK